MKNTKDNSIIRLFIIFIAYYLVYNYMPLLFPQFSKLVNLIIRDIVMIIIAVLIYFKDIKREYSRFRKSKHKFLFICWAIGIYAVCYFLCIVIKKYYPSLLSLGDFNYYIRNSFSSSSKVYTYLNIILLSSIIEAFVYNLSFRKVLNKDLLFIIISSLVFTYFGCLLGENFSTKILLGLLIVRFIPCVLYNIAYIKNNNNIITLVFMIMIVKAIPFIMLLVK